MVHPERIIAALNEHGVRYIVIGGIAATLHGCPDWARRCRKLGFLPGLDEFDTSWLHQLVPV